MTAQVHGPIEYRVIVHDEDGALWAEVEELPGLFVTGDDADELLEALTEAVQMYLSTPESPLEVKIDRLERTGEVHDAHLTVC